MQDAVRRIDRIRDRIAERRAWRDSNSVSLPRLIFMTSPWQKYDQARRVYYDAPAFFEASEQLPSVLIGRECIRRDRISS
jgi:hypothetical protein